MASNRNAIYGLGTLCLEGKTDYQLKQQFVTKTLIPKILTKHITNHSMEKTLAWQKFSLQCTFS
jgi:hypothetical protein